MDSKRHEIPFDYRQIDTSLVSNYSDEKLLRQMMAIDWVSKGGHGLVAELCKRLEQRKNDGL